MLRLPETLRQSLAALIALLVFLLLYLGAALVWWLAAILAVATYAGLLMLPLAQIDADGPEASDDSLPGADILALTDALSEASERLMGAAPDLGGSDAELLEDMSGYLQGIRNHLLDSPPDHSALRKFVVAQLPEIVSAAEDHAARRDEAVDPGETDRVRRRLTAYAAALEAMELAALENDFGTLEAQTATLDALERRG